MHFLVATAPGNSLTNTKMSFDKIVLITRRTRLEGLRRRFNTVAQAAFYIKAGGGDFDFYQREHKRYYDAAEELEEQLGRYLKVHTIERDFLPNYLFAEGDLVVTVGIDGLVVNTAKYLDGQPVIAVNPDPENIDGVLLPFSVEQAADAVERVLRGDYSVRDITMAEATLQDGQRLLAFNDFFIGAEDHVSARYRIQHSGREENHSSSGIIVSTGAGSTGWLSSIFNMANGLMTEFAGPEEPILFPPRLEWDARQLVYVVREPFVSKTSQAGIVSGLITPELPLEVESHMAQGGVIFSDGVATDFLAFNGGAIATIGVADRVTRLVV